MIATIFANPAVAIGLIATAVVLVALLPERGRRESTDSRAVNEGGGPRRGI